MITVFKQKQTRVNGALGTDHAYPGLFLKTENPHETEFSGDKTARFRKRLPWSFLKTLDYRFSVDEQKLGFRIRK